ncbi:MAG: GGDEF domain-containing protein, partial [Desulfocucumaceae bacterium]
MTIWIAGAGGLFLFLLGITAGKFFPVIHLIWLLYTVGLLVLIVSWVRHLAAHTENLLQEIPDDYIAAKAFPLKAVEFSRVDRNMARIYRKLQLAEFASLNQKARQAGENFDLMLSNTTDPLTGVPNRRGLDRHLEKALGRVNPLSVIMVDIDHFKRVNDTYGHDAGDLVLQQVASVIKNSVRPGDFMGRFGGEEFMVVCNADIDEAVEIAERVRQAVMSTPVSISDSVTVSITASFGVALHLPGEDA